MLFKEKKNRKKYSKSKAKFSFKKFFFYVSIFIIVFLTVCFGFLFAIINEYKKDLPSISILEDYNPGEITNIYSKDGILLNIIYDTNRNVVSLKDLPPQLIKAFIAMEDARFYKHRGFDIWRIMGALFHDLMTLSKEQGASTITQQLVRNIPEMKLNRKKFFSRKIKEILIAIEVEKAYTKDEILELYLNQIYLGAGAYGVYSASKIYFGKEPKDLTLPECALLAAMPKAPSVYNPHRNPKLALERRNIVLKMMLKNNDINRNEYEKAVKEPLNIIPIQFAIKAPYFVDYVRKELFNMYESDKVLNSGWSVYTTLNYADQKKAEEYYEEHLQKLEKLHNYEFVRFPDSLGKSGKNDNYEQNDDDTQKTKYLQGALIAMDVKTGAILSMIGGRDFISSNFNRSVQAKRQVGSTFKPFVYTAAMENGYTPSDIVIDAPIEIKVGDEIWKPKNYSREYKGAMTMKYALSHSINTAAVNVMQMVGLDAVLDVAKRFHLEDNGVVLPRVPSIAIGVADMPLINLTAAFNVYANDGVYVAPYAIDYIVDSYGNEIYKHQVNEERIISPDTNYMMLEMLKGVVEGGTASSIRRYGFNVECGGKTGTSNDHHDAYFVGFTPKITCGVWVGFDQAQPLGPRETGASAALPIWIGYMKYSHRFAGSDTLHFAKPEESIAVEVCQLSGLLPTPFCPIVTKEYFKKGKEPKEKCKMHQKESDKNREQDVYEEDEF